MVVLHGHQFQLGVRGGQLPGVLGRQVLRVHVAGDNLRLDAEELFIKLNRICKMLQRLQVLHVADMLGHEGEVVPRQAEGVLLLGAHAQYRLASKIQADGMGGVAAGAPGKAGGAALDNHDAVVVAGVDIAVVAQEVVGDAAQSRYRLVVIAGDGLLAEVAGGHHQRAARLPHEEVVEGGIGEHHAQVFQAGRHALRHRGLRFPAQQDDGAAGGAQEIGLRLAHLAVPFYLVQRGQHHRQRFGGAVLAPPQAANGLIAGGVAGQQVAPQPLDSHDSTVLEPRRGLGNNIVTGYRVPPGINESEAGPADRAGVGLGVEAAVGGVVVLFLAGRAHLEDTHGGVGAVVGYIGDDGEARAAVGAVGEGVAVAAVGGVEDFPQAVGAGGDVRRDELVFTRLGDALAYLEPVIAGRLTGCDGNILDVRHGRGIMFQVMAEALDGGRLTLYLDADGPGGVQHPPFQAVAGGQLVDEGAEADALHHASDAEAGQAENRCPCHDITYPACP